ncbi:NADH dehydrogenase [ubiquinone] 1 beta subcomplex subunit 2, mitochondrial [Habropoda laboriosa]|uniref:NADH dehydrogenase [ubiquinone] 1 beta subcomplex subunit 2, mitochondrial n=1 Tax=Habropoda laboriosa TaxID=597456 RepID=A0A0L7QVW2_9HYME|nr:NADH dehydrogenase [ubiquinone] 1 beta subcomplex subunit 2, mitochondrial [Habropoda laboriosa]
MVVFRRPGHEAFDDEEAQDTAEPRAPTDDDERVRECADERRRWCYRMVPEPRKGWTFVADFLGGLMWWWVFWNFWHESAHITGHFPFPRPADWSDEELGIPAD